MEDFAYIEAYLADELSAEERRQFERRLQSDPDFAADFALQKDSHQLLTLGKQLHYKQELQALDAELRSPVRPLWQRWQAAAAVVMLLVASAVLWLTQEPGDPYRAAFAPYPDRLTLRQGEGDSLLQASMQAYQVGDFAAAAKGLRQLAQGEGSSAAHRFYLGVALLGDQRYVTADSVLVTLDPTSLYHPASQWYRALALGQAGEQGLARQMLEKMAQNERHPFQNEAQALLEKLNP